MLKECPSDVRGFLFDGLQDARGQQVDSPRGDCDGVALPDQGDPSASSSASFASRGPAAAVPLATASVSLAILALITARSHTVANRVERFTETLDAISEDIKAVEKWLQDSGVRVEAELIYHDSAYVTDPAPSGIDIGGPFRGRRDTSALAWGPVAEGRAWRLFYRERVQRGTWEEGDWAWDESGPELIDARPLIETPASTRLSLGDSLAKLVEEIASKIPVYTQETLIEGDLHVSDRSFPESGTGPWFVYFQTGPDIESVTGQRLYDTWNEVLDALARLSGEEPSDSLEPHGYVFTKLKTPVRILRELKLM